MPGDSPETTFRWRCWLSIAWRLLLLTAEAHKDLLATGSQATIADFANIQRPRVPAGTPVFPSITVASEASRPAEAAEVERQRKRQK